MSRQIDWDKKLSDDDRQWALDRGMYYRVDENDARFGDEKVLTDEQRVRASGILGTEPSAGSDRTEPLGPTPQQRGLHTDQAGKPLDPETGLPREAATSGGGDEEGDQYDEMTKGELRDEVDSRNEDRDDDSRIPVSGTAEDLRKRLREDDQSE